MDQKKTKKTKKNRKTIQKNQQNSLSDACFTFHNLHEKLPQIYLYCIFYIWTFNVGAGFKSCIWKNTEHGD